MITNNFELIILFGRPGSGKGTISQFLKRTHNYEHLSVGDLFRNELQQKTPFGISHKQQIESIQGLLPDNVVIEVISSFIRKSIKHGQKLVLDGFPRTNNQLKALEKILCSEKVLDRLYYFYVDIDLTSAEKRILDRLICSNCNLVYHKEYLPPKKPGICDECSKEISKRPGDVAESLPERFSAFEQNVLPLIFLIEKRKFSNFYKLNGNLPLSEIIREIYSILKLDLLHV